MIYTVTLNPCLDYIVRTDALRPGALCRTHGETLYPGGKGVNVSLVCAALGAAHARARVYRRAHGRAVRLAAGRDRRGI